MHVKYPLLDYNNSLANATLTIKDPNGRTLGNSSAFFQVDFEQDMSFNLKTAFLTCLITLQNNLPPANSDLITWALLSSLDPKSARSTTILKPNELNCNAVEGRFKLAFGSLTASVKIGYATHPYNPYNP